MSMNWEDATQYYKNVTDKLGKKIDTGIFETVVALNLLGIATKQSCEGHTGWGVPYPWIDIIFEPPYLLLLYQYLVEFYSTRPLDFDRMLVLHGCRIRPNGATVSELSTESEQSARLSLYQAEMHAFSDFLRGEIRKQ